MHATGLYSKLFTGGAFKQIALGSLALSICLLLLALFGDLAIEDRTAITFISCVQIGLIIALAWVHVHSLDKVRLKTHEQAKASNIKHSREIHETNLALQDEIAQRRRAEEKALEKARQVEQAKDRLLSASRMGALGEMASGISHEINNPLTILKGYLFVITDAILKPDFPRHRILEVCQKAVATCDRIAKIVKGLHDFANHEQQDQVIEFSLRQAVDRALTFSQERLISLAIGLIVEEIDESITVLGRPGDLTQVILSLILNASDAVKGLETKWIHIKAVSIGSSHERVALRIADSGNGIPAGIVAKIFTPFFTTKDPGAGQGIGLSVSYAIVASWGGELRYVAGLPHTTFEIELRQNGASENSAKIG